MSTAEAHRLTATQVRNKLRKGELSVEQYAQSLLSHIQKRDSVVKGWAHLDPEYVIKEAKRLDALPEDARGPLHGVAIGVKDVIYTKDQPTQYGSRLYGGEDPKVDAACVKVLRQAGALLLGKTATTEMAATNVGPPTTNPHDSSRTPGGSSSGSGAVVADFQVPIALGTQTGGSTIRPGSFNGIYAFKPTWNTISREGNVLYSLIMDTIGFYARSPEDFELLMDIFDVEDDDQPRANLQLQGAKFAFSKTMQWKHAGPGTVRALEKAVDILRGQGAVVDEFVFPEDLNDIPKWHKTVLDNDGKITFLGDYRRGKDHMDALLVDYVEGKYKVTRKEYLHAFDNIAAARPRIDKLMSGFEALIVPSVPDEAPIGIESTGSSAFNCLWTALHTPVINVPAFVGENGMPVGVSLVGPRHADRHLLKVAQLVGKVLEAEGGWKSDL